LLHTIVIAAVVVIATAYGVPPQQLFLVGCAAPLGLMAAMLPISVAGHGVREMAFIYLLSHLGILPEVALAISLSIYVMIALVSLMGGGVYIFDTMSHKSHTPYLDKQHLISPS
jgi:hypothetical protein